MLFKLLIFHRLVFLILVHWKMKTKYTKYLFLICLGFQYFCWCIFQWFGDLKTQNSPFGAKHGGTLGSY